MRKIPVMERIEADQEACRAAVAALRAQQEAPPPNDPLTTEELREMDDADVWVAYPPSVDGERLILHALVEVVKENGVVWLTNNLGGRSIFGKVCDDGAVVYRRRPEEVN